MISKSLHFVDSLELLTLADFWSRFEIIYGKQERVSDEADDDFDNENEKEKHLLQTYQLKDGFGLIRERRNAAVLRYYSPKDDDYEKLREAFQIVSFQYFIVIF